ncbi:hypothetical protein KQI77_07985 [Clostridium sp. MSJ-8]|uniref:hypothetical protein n=1 Tax=Clostridium sp. MSJ-8 TaxID=2841510 RepID=UPI001C0E97D9|nr:hypothetical protein [Clostridium sp. MSJ-8]MBU5488096.1 hypothetical protein [Clostridium sp. MSJ-8]
MKVILLSIYGLFNCLSEIILFSMSMNNTFEGWHATKLVVYQPSFILLGNYKKMFQGIFEGNNHSIKGLYMVDFSKTVGYQSLFGTLYAGTIRDLGIEESY